MSYMHWVYSLALSGLSIPYKDKLNLILIKYGNPSLCISLTFIEQSAILNREIIIKACDVNIGYPSGKKKSLVVVAPNGHLLLMVSFLFDLT